MLDLYKCEVHNELDCHQLISKFPWPFVFCNKLRQLAKSIRTADECFRAKFDGWLVVRKEVLEDYVDDIGSGV